MVAISSALVGSTYFVTTKLIKSDAHEKEIQELKDILKESIQEMKRENKDRIEETNRENNDRIQEIKDLLNGNIAQRVSKIEGYWWWRW